jgi:hypothetical protein
MRTYLTFFNKSLKKSKIQISQISTKKNINDEYFEIKWQIIPTVAIQCPHAHAHPHPHAQVAMLTRSSAMSPTAAHQCPYAHAHPHPHAQVAMLTRSSAMSPTAAHQCPHAHAHPHPHAQVAICQRFFHAILDFQPAVAVSTLNFWFVQTF